MAGGLVFFTGFPGFIGKRLVERLLADDPELRVAALVEVRMAATAREAAGQLPGGERIEVLTGDIGDRRLGLADADYERLTAEVTSAYHLAAIYNLAVPLEVAQRVNVEGTGNVLELCVRAERLERLNYVSTAYVAGLRTGVVYEHELVMGQRHKNHYESTKFQAEVWVRNWMDSVPTTVYRPAIVVGDSKTGETQKFDGPYYVLRTIARAGAGPLAQFGRSAAPFNVVPVDFIVDAMAAVAADPRAVGETLHLVDPEPITAADLFGALAREYAGREPSFRVPSRLVESSLRFDAVRKQFGGAPFESIQYLNHAVRFDTRRADEVLSRNGLRCPRFEEYVGTMVRFFREHERDQALTPAGAVL
jgi:thioester reductase-like protein